MADCANLSNSVNVMYDNIGFSWSGFNDSMPNYVNETIKKLKEMPSLDLTEMFEQTKEKLLLEWKNAYLGQSYNQAFSLFDSATLSRAVEKKVLRPLLENYSYERFNSELAQWMQSGRYTWYINGNISSDAAIEIVEKTRSTLGLTNLPVTSIGDYQFIALEAGYSTLIVLPLEDKSNENSCSLTYYEVGPVKGDYKQTLVNKVMMQWLK